MQILGNVHESIKQELILLLYQHLQARSLTSYAMVVIDYPGVSVPSGFDNDGVITLDVSASACRDFLLADGWIYFGRCVFFGYIQAHFLRKRYAYCIFERYVSMPNYDRYSMLDNRS